MKIELDDYQIEAIDKLKNGCILNGGVGSGKSRTALAYFCKCNGGCLANNWEMYQAPRDLYIITTPKKRDSLEWERELGIFLMSSLGKTRYKHTVVIDSWNNIQKYKKVFGAFFIFDEQRVVGKGAWVKAFLDISRKNQWILCSATPGDTWEDYVPVFLANHFYKSRYDFGNQHIVWAPYVKFPKILRYTNEEKLEYLRSQVLVNLDYSPSTNRHQLYILCEYDRSLYNKTIKQRFNYDKGRPMKNAGELCYALRRIANSDESRQVEVLKILEHHPKSIIFYNFDYELEILINLCESNNIVYSQWNGHRHEPIPRTTAWVYLVQYTSGAEGWNCIETDTVIFYSQNYSYKIMEQSCGRIDRRNTPYKDLFFYNLRSVAPIDIAIKHSIAVKKKFNEKSFCGKFFEKGDAI